MARLILLNGVPAAGKSTLARHWIARHPLALSLDLDVVRSLLGASLDDPTAAGTRARALGLAMAGDHLVAGHDVIVPQFLGRPEFVAQLAAIAARSGASFVEVLLEVDPAEAERRFAERSAAGADPAHADAAVLQAASGDTIAAQLRRVLAVVADRPSTLRVASVPGDPDATLAALDAAIDRPADGPTSDRMER